jgi:hypothetical protein
MKGVEEGDTVYRVPRGGFGVWWAKEDGKLTNTYWSLEGMIMKE